MSPRKFARHGNEQQKHPKKAVTYLKWAHEILGHLHNRARVVELAAVVRRREYRDQLSLGKELVSIFNDLRVGRMHAETSIVPIALYGQS